MSLFYENCVYIENFPFLIQSDCLFHQCFIYKGPHLASQNIYSNTSDSDFWDFPVSGNNVYNTNV